MPGGRGPPLAGLAAEALADCPEEPVRRCGRCSRGVFCQHGCVATVWSVVTLDCLDPERVARFGGALLGRQPGPSESGWVYLGERGDPQPRLVFQPVSEAQTGKVRI